MLPKVFLNIFYVANNERIDMEENSDIDILKTYLDMNRTSVVQRQTTVTAYFSCKQLLVTSGDKKPASLGQFGRPDLAAAVGHLSTWSSWLTTAHAYIIKTIALLP